MKYDVFFRFFGVVVFYCIFEFLKTPYFLHIDTTMATLEKQGKILRPVGRVPIINNPSYHHFWFLFCPQETLNKDSLQNQSISMLLTNLRKHEVTSAPHYGIPQAEDLCCVVLADHGHITPDIVNLHTLPGLFSES